MSLGDRLRELRGKESQTVAGRRLGVSQSAYANYERDFRPPDAEFIKSVCSAYGVTADWLLFGGDAPPVEVVSLEERRDCVAGDTASYRLHVPPGPAPDPTTFEFVPLVAARFSTGGGAFVLSEAIESYFAFPREWLRRRATSTKNLVLVQIIGLSMFPHLHPGDIAMIDMGRRDIHEGMVYGLRMDHTLMIKRLFVRPGDQIRVVSDNKEEYEPYDVHRSELHIIGQIITICRSFVVDP